MSPHIKLPYTTPFFTQHNFHPVPVLLLSLTIASLKILFTILLFEGERTRSFIENLWEHALNKFNLNKLGNNVINWYVVLKREFKLPVSSMNNKTHFSITSVSVISEKANRAHFSQINLCLVLFVESSDQRPHLGISNHIGCCKYLCGLHTDPDPD